MIEYKTPTVTISNELYDDTNCASIQTTDGKLSLNKLWEIILRTKQLPSKKN